MNFKQLLFNSREQDLIVKIMDKDKNSCDDEISSADNNKEPSECKQYDFYRTLGQENNNRRFHMTTFREELKSYL